MNILKTAIAPAVIGTTMTLSSCDKTVSSVAESRKGVLTEIMANKPAKDFDKIVAGWDNKELYMNDIKSQSSLDSVAYRNLFDGTVLANNSKKVKEFNEIAKNTRPDKESIKDISQSVHVTEAQDAKIKDLGVTKKAFDSFQEEYKKIGDFRSNGFGTTWEPDYSKIIATRQFKADSMAYDNFFKKNNVMTDTLQKEIKKIAKVIKP